MVETDQIRIDEIQRKLRHRYMLLVGLNIIAYLTVIAFCIVGCNKIGGYSGNSYAFDTDFEVFIGKPAGNTEEELLVNVNLSNYPLRELKSLIKASNAAVAQFDTMGKRNKKKDEKHLNKHAMHLVRLYLMAFDILEKGEINTYRDKDHNLLMSIRNGAYMNTDGSFKHDFFEMVDGYEKRLQYDSKNTELPDNPDFEQVQELVMTINAMTLGIAELPVQ